MVKRTWRAVVDFARLLLGYETVQEWWARKRLDLVVDAQKLSTPFEEDGGDSECHRDGDA